MKVLVVGFRRVNDVDEVRVLGFDRGQLAGEAFALDFDQRAAQLVELGAELLDAMADGEKLHEKRLTGAGHERHCAHPAQSLLFGSVKSGKEIARSPFAVHENELLQLLPPATLRRLEPHMREVRPAYASVVLEQDARCEFGYFPLRPCVVSFTRQTENGTMIEVGLIGCEGFAGTSTLLDPRRQRDRGLIQSEGPLLEIPIAVMREEIGRDAALRELVFRYVAAYLMQVAQSALCNRLHTVEQRLAKWILMFHDRTAQEWRMTQEFLANMLGVRTAGVNEAIRAAEEARVIGHARQRLTVLDRKGLEARACECYAAVKQEFDLIREP